MSTHSSIIFDGRMLIVIIIILLFNFGLLVLGGFMAGFHIKNYDYEININKYWWVVVLSPSIILILIICMFSSSQNYGFYRIARIIFLFLLISYVITAIIMTSLFLKEVKLKDNIDYPYAKDVISTTKWMLVFLCIILFLLFVYIYVYRVIINELPKSIVNR